MQLNQQYYNVEDGIVSVLNETELDVVVWSKLTKSTLVTGMKWFFSTIQLRC